MRPCLFTLEPGHYILVMRMERRFSEDYVFHGPSGDLSSINHPIGLKPRCLRPHVHPR